MMSTIHYPNDFFPTMTINFVIGVAQILFDLKIYQRPCHLNQLYKKN